jgi:outer membrane protein TolC
MKRFAAQLCRTAVAALAIALLLALQTASGLAQERGSRAQPYVVPQQLSLETAVTIGLQGSTGMASLQARMDAARTAKRASWFNLGPDLRVDASKTEQHRTDYDQVVGITPDSTYIYEDQSELSTFRSVGANSSVRLFDGFANWAAISAAQKDIEAHEYNYEYSATQVETGIVAAYYRLLQSKLLLTVAREAEEVAREQLERTQALYDLGSAARSDVLRSQVNLGNQSLALVQARNQVRQDYDGLVYAMNLFITTPFDIDTTLATIPAEEFDFLEQIEYARQNRLDLKAMRAVEEASGSRVTVARGPLYPTFDVSYRYNFSKTSTAFTFGSGKTQTNAWSLSTSWAVFDRYQTYSNISSAKANRRIAEYNRQQVELDAVREIRGYLNQLREARERLAVASENVLRAEEDLRLAIEKFRVGAGTILDRITAESDLTTTRSEEVTAVVDYLVAKANLFRATGRPLSEL